MPNFEASVELPLPRVEVFGYHTRPAALDRLLPPRGDVELIERPASLETGSTAVIKLGLLGLSKRWVAEHIRYEPPAAFTDIQRSGPLAAWRHDHLFEQTSDASCRLIDRVEYRVSRIPGVDAAARQMVSGELQSMFAYRHRVTRDDLRFIQSLQSSGLRKIAVSGSGGLIGHRLVALANVAGIDVICLHRVKDAAEIATSPSHNKRVSFATQTPWHVESGGIRVADWDAVDAFIHLAGENIAGGRWTDGFKKKLYESRVGATRRLIDSLTRDGRLPATVVTASGAGIYPSSGGTLLREEDPAADDFLGTLATDWEAASAIAAERGSRWCAGRLGMVLDPRHGALVPLLWQTRLFAAGRVGDGNAYWSWIERDDAAAALLHLATNSSCHGAYNLSGEPQTNRDFIQTLASVMKRPAWLAAPASLLRVAVGELADGALLRSNNLDNGKLQSSGYRLRFPRLQEALRHLLV